MLTHGHEDHIGATPFLLRERGDIPLVGSELTLALLGSKLKEHRLRETVHHKVREGERISFGPFDLEFIAVNHSIPDALAVAIRTPAGLVLHTGDFKMDQLPLDGRITDLRAFARLGEEGVDLFLTDSTNAEVPGFTTSEKEISPVLERVFHESSGRLIVACFASHVHRVQQVLDAAVVHGRKVGYVGRSMVRNMAIARDLGYLTVPPGVLVDAKELADIAPEKQVLVSTEQPGRAAQRPQPDRPAQPPLRPHRRGRHRRARLVVDPRQRERRLPRHQRPLQVGRPHRPQGQRAGPRQRPRQRGRAALLLQHRPAPQRAARPRRDPAHAGQRRAGARHRRPGRPGGRRGGRHRRRPGRRARRIAGKVECGYVFVDGSSVGDITESDLKDRRILGEEGFISVIVVVDSVTAEDVGGPEIHARGSRRTNTTFNDIKQPIIDALDRATSEGVLDSYQLSGRRRFTAGGSADGSTTHIVAGQ